MNEIRKTIYTSNAIESVNSALRKVTNGIHLQNIIFKSRRIRRIMKKPIPNWNKIEIQLSEIYKERFTKYLDI